MAQACDARSSPGGRALAVGHGRCFGEGGGECPLAWAFEDASEKVGADAPSALGGVEGA